MEEGEEDEEEEEEERVDDDFTVDDMKALAALSIRRSKGMCEEFSSEIDDISSKGRTR